MPYHCFIELTDGRLYPYDPNFETTEIYTYLNATIDKIQYIPATTGGGID